MCIYTEEWNCFIILRPRAAPGQYILCKVFAPFYCASLQIYCIATRENVGALQLLHDDRDSVSQAHTQGKMYVNKPLLCSCLLPVLVVISLVIHPTKFMEHWFCSFSPIWYTSVDSFCSGNSISFLIQEMHWPILIAQVLKWVHPYMYVYTRSDAPNRLKEQVPIFGREKFMDYYLGIKKFIVTSISVVLRKS